MVRRHISVGFANCASRSYVTKRELKSNFSFPISRCKIFPGALQNPAAVFNSGRAPAFTAGQGNWCGVLIASHDEQISSLSICMLMRSLVLSKYCQGVRLVAMQEPCWYNPKLLWSWLAATPPVGGLGILWMGGRRKNLQKMTFQIKRKEIYCFPERWTRVLGLLKGRFAGDGREERPVGSGRWEERTLLSVF